MGMLALMEGCDGAGAWACLLWRGDAAEFVSGHARTGEVSLTETHDADQLCVHFYFEIFLS